MNQETASYTPRPDDCLRKLAKDIASGKICVYEPGDLRFPIFRLLGSETLDQMIADEISMCYEYIDKAADRGFFFSFQMLNREDHEKLVGFLDDLKLAQDRVARGEAS